MTWVIKFSKKAERQINALDRIAQSRIKTAILEKLQVNPYLYLKSLTGELGKYNKFRVGNYRLICEKRDNELIIVVVKVEHRSKVYK